MGWGSAESVVGGNDICGTVVLAYEQPTSRRVRLCTARRSVEVRHPPWGCSVNHRCRCHRGSIGFPGGFAGQVDENDQQTFGLTSSERKLA